MKRQIIKFCKTSCCPTVEVDEDKIILGDPNGPEGITVWTKDQFNDFLTAAKEGKFDNI